jgi:hypothetical protein
VAVQQRHARIAIATKSIHSRTRGRFIWAAPAAAVELTEPTAVLTEPIADLQAIATDILDHVLPKLKIAAGT